MNEDAGCIGLVVGLTGVLIACGLSGGALWWTSKLVDRVDVLEAEIDAVNRETAVGYDPDVDQGAAIEELQSEVERLDFQIGSHTGDTARSAHGGL